MFKSNIVRAAYIAYLIYMYVVVLANLRPYFDLWSYGLAALIIVALHKLLQRVLPDLFPPDDNSV